jgi:hypothetical protein
VQDILIVCVLPVCRDGAEAATAVAAAAANTVGGAADSSSGSSDAKAQQEDVAFGSKAQKQGAERPMSSKPGLKNSRAAGSRASVAHAGSQPAR